jgi:glycosyltransferase involved in cell wall biosynthesis
MYDAINKGLKIATGDIIAYLNSDDKYVTGTLEYVNETYNQTGFNLLYGNLEFIDNDNRKLYTRKYFNVSLKLFSAMNYSLIGQPASFFSKKVLQKVGGFDSSLKMAGDHFFYLKTLKYFKGDYVNRVLAEFRFHEDSLTANYLSVSENEIKEFHREHYIGFAKLSRFAYSIFGDFMFKVINYKVYLKRFL